MEFILNNRTIKTLKPGGMTLLDFIRYESRLTGTKIGCREGDCGACTVLIGEPENGRLRYRSMTSCITPLINAEGKHVVTIEGLNMSELSPVQKAFVEAGGTQCGFCTVGFIVSLSGYCLEASAATEGGGIGCIDGNICRCTGYKSIERASAEVVGKLANKDLEHPIEWLVKSKFVPEYFLEIPGRLNDIRNRLSSTNGLQSKPSKARIGGGTDLYVQRPEELMESHVEGFLSRDDLKGIRREGNTMVIGASATVSDLFESPEFNTQFPNLKKHFKLISSTQIRNMGTVAGNFVNASPIGDLTIYFLALNSTITMADLAGKKRTILLKDFYKGYKTIDKHPDEHVETIQFDVPDETTRFNFEKVSKRTNLDIASVNSAIRLKLNGDMIINVQVSAGGVGPIPLYLRKTSEFLKGKPLSPETVSSATEIMLHEISPISDARGSKEYKTLLLRQVFFAHFIELFPEKFTMDVLV